MKKLLCGVISALFMVAAFAAPSIKTLYVGLGAENALKILDIQVNGKSVGGAQDFYKPAEWNAIASFPRQALSAGDSVTFKFQNLAKGADPWNCWGLAVWADEENYQEANGQYLRGDTWLNGFDDAGFAGGLWRAGKGPANFKYSSGFNYLNAASQLKSKSTVTVTVSFDGSNITVTETVDGKTAMTVSSTAW